MNVSNSSAENITFLTDVLPVSSTSHMRNQLLGSVGLLCNITAIVLLWLSRSIWSSLKMSLISLSLSDLLIMIVAAVWRPSLPCWPAMYIISSTILVSYFSTVVLALHNYLAVFYPTRCKQILSTSRTLFMLVSCWLVGCLLSLVCLGVQIPNGSSCYVIAIMPRTGVVVESCICLLCCCFITVTNLRVLVHIRKRAKPGTRSDLRATQASLQPVGSASANIFCRTRNSCESSVAPTSSSASSIAIFLGQNSSGTLSSSSIVPNTTPPNSVRTMDSITATDKTFKISRVHHFPTKKPSESEQSICTPIEVEGNCSSESTPNKGLVLNQRIRKRSHNIAQSDMSPISQSVRTSKNTRSVQLGIYDEPHTSQMSYLEVPVSSRLSRDIKISANSASGHSITNTTGHSGKLQVQLKSTQRRIEPTESQNNLIVNNQKQGAYSLNLKLSNRECEVDEGEPCINCETNAGEEMQGTPLEGEVPTQPPTKSCCDRESSEKIFTQKLDGSSVLVENTNPDASGSLSTEDVKTNKKALDSQYYNYKTDETCPNMVGEKETPVLSNLRGMALSFQNPIETGKTETGAEKSIENTEDIKSGERLEKDKLPRKETVPGRESSLTSYSSPTPTSNAVLTLDRNEDLQECDCSENDQPSNTISREADLSTRSTTDEHPLNIVKCASSGFLTTLRQTSASSHENEEGQGRTLSSVLIGLRRSNLNFLRSTSEPQANRRCWQLRTQYTLLILCSWCCLVSLPYIVYGGYVAIWIDDRARFISSGLGILVSSLAGLSSITNPILYAWRFVKWGEIWKKCKRHFRG